MTMENFSNQINKPGFDDEVLFQVIANNIRDQGYSINFNAISPLLSEKLWLHLQKMNTEKFEPAGLGRKSNHNLNNFIRRDEICWITGESEAGRDWLKWSESLKNYLNLKLFLGLFSFESHFAHYEPGAFYKKHVDAFTGNSNRILSVVLYLNPGWLPEDGGELVIYTDNIEGVDNKSNRDYTIKVTPSFGTLVTFLSEEFPHEVLKSKRDRYSIAGWFRINTSTSDRVDPYQ